MQNVHLDVMDCVLAWEKELSTTAALPLGDRCGKKLSIDDVGSGDNLIGCEVRIIDASRHPDLKRYFLTQGRVVKVSMQGGQYVLEIKMHDGHTYELKDTEVKFL